MDRQGISNQLLKHGGEDMVESIIEIFNQIEELNAGPDTWEDITIKSIYKGKGSKKEMDNRRGIFITNSMSKLFENVKLSKQRETIENNISKFQTGGIKGKSTIDNIMVLNATIDYNNLINKETYYVLFADAYKCFDKLDLRTCVADMYEILGAREAKLIYELNKKANIVIKTPVGDTESIQVKEITKQGTLYGPVLCDVNTDKINKIGTKTISTIGPSTQSEALIYVDDIQHAGSNIRTIEQTASNCAMMETTRKFIFNNKVDKTAFIVINAKKNNEIKELRTKIKRGAIKRTDKYRYLGEWYNEKGNHETSLKDKENKISTMINQTKYYGDPYKVGELAIQVRLQLFESTIIPTILHPYIT